MKAAVLHEYGPPSKFRYEDAPDPKPGPGEILVRVSAASLNPIDWKMRSGVIRQMFPLNFPAILGRDLAGVVREVGEGVQGFAAGDRVCALSQSTYAELAVLKFADAAHVPEGLDMTVAAAIPLVSVTGDQLIRKGAQVQPGQTVLISGALGSVGRCAVFAAAEIGAKVIAGVRAKQIDEARALRGVTDAVALDDDDSLARVGLVDSVADTVGGATAAKLLGKVKQGGIFGSVLGPPPDAALHPTVQIVPVYAQPDAATYAHYAEAVRDGRLLLPVEHVLPLTEIAAAHSLGEKGGSGKIVVVP